MAAEDRLLSLPNTISEGVDEVPTRDLQYRALICFLPPLRIGRP